MTNIKHEDAIMKMGFDYFRDNILKILGIAYEFIDVSPTELIEINIHSLYMDFTFLTTNDFYVHIEFQTTDAGPKDLRRFHSYEAVYSHKTGKNVITYVIYSGGITHTKTELDCGLYTYRIHPIYLKEKNSDEILSRLKEKQKIGAVFSDEDYASLSLTPLMSGSMSKKDTIREALLLTKYSTQLSAEKTAAMLYVLADKFLEGADLEEIREVIKMTKLGQMLLDEGIEKGIEKGESLGMKLSKQLLEDNRIDDLRRAVDDKIYRKKLLDEYEIE